MSLTVCARLCQRLLTSDLPLPLIQTNGLATARPSFSPPALGDHFLGVGIAGSPSGSPSLVLGQLPDLSAPGGNDDDATLAAQMAAFGFGGVGKAKSSASQLPGQSVFGGFDLLQAERASVAEQQPLSPGEGIELEGWSVLASPKKGGTRRRHRRSSSSIARELGVDQEMIRRVAEQLGMRS